MSLADLQRQLIMWTATVSTMTCGEWNESTGDEQAAAAAELLAGIREVESPNAGAASPDQVSQLQTGITDLCDAGANCGDPNNFCDTASIADAAVGAYIVARDALRP